MDKTKLGIEQTLLELCDGFLDGKIQATDFSERFENLMFDSDIERDRYKQLEDIIDAIEYYEPDENIRENEPHCINETQLQDVVRKTVHAYNQRFNDEQ